MPDVFTLPTDPGPGLCNQQYGNSKSSCPLNGVCMKHAHGGAASVCRDFGKARGTPTVATPTSDRDTFLKYCASLEDKELAGAAAARLVWMLKSHNLTWEQILSPFAFHQAGPAAAVGAHGPECEAILLGAAKAQIRVTDWEREFLKSISTKATLTPKQAAVWNEKRVKFAKALAP